jgi:hypothetical protein
LEFQFRGETSTFEVDKLVREKLYGKVAELAFDQQGHPSRKVNLLDDGQTLLGLGSLAMGKLSTNGEWLSSDKLIPTLPDGKPAQTEPSSFEAPIDLRSTAKVEDVLDILAVSVYQLSSQVLSDSLEQALNEGTIFRFPFCLRTGITVYDGFLLNNAEKRPFLLVGQPAYPRMIGLSEVEPVDEGNLEDDESDDLDFGMI